MVWSQIIYGQRTASILPNIVRFYGARTAPGRQQEESYDKIYFYELSKSLNTSADARPCTGRCFVSRSATGEKRRVFAEIHIAST